MSDEEWWGCRRCPKKIRKDTWKAHGNAHAMVEAARRMKLSADRATGDAENLYLCGICASHRGDETALMDHIEEKHFFVVAYVPEGKTRPSW
jgi:hypothetical protein